MNNNINTINEQLTIVVANFKITCINDHCGCLAAIRCSSHNNEDTSKCKSTTGIDGCRFHGLSIGEALIRAVLQMVLIHPLVRKAHIVHVAIKVMSMVALCTCTLECCLSSTCYKVSPHSLLPFLTLLGFVEPNKNINGNTKYNKLKKIELL